MTWGLQGHDESACKHTYRGSKCMRDGTAEASCYGLSENNNSPVKLERLSQGAARKQCLIIGPPCRHVCINPINQIVPRHCRDQRQMLNNISLYSIKANGRISKRVLQEICGGISVARVSHAHCDSFGSINGASARDGTAAADSPGSTLPSRRAGSWRYEDLGISPPHHISRAESNQPLKM